MTNHTEGRIGRYLASLEIQTKITHVGRLMLMGFVEQIAREYFLLGGGNPEEFEKHWNQQKKQQ